MLSLQAILKNLNRLTTGLFIKTGNLNKRQGPDELVLLYDRWQTAARIIDREVHFQHDVALYFIYKGIRYILTPEEFGLTHADADLLILQYIIPDLWEIGMEHYFITGHIDEIPLVS